MGKNVVEKILSQHIISGQPKAGQEVTIKMDQTLTQDATGTMAYLQLEVLNPEKLATELSVSYVDHNTTQIGFENFDDHQYLESIAKKYGINFSKAGNGICHQVHLERFGQPGTTLLGSDSHTPTGGGIAQFAVGAGGLDVAVAMAKGTFTFKYPAVTNVILTGQLSPWVAAKDVILKLLEILTTKGNVGTVIEYSGPGVQTLSVPQRATMTNMGAELGVTTSLFPSDEKTQQFLKSQGRAGQWLALQADADAVYDKVIELDLSTIQPMAAKPHSPDNIATIEALKGTKVQQVCIGSCTNSSYQDLMTAAMMLKNKKIHSDTSFVVAPGSRQVLQMITENGALATFIAAGARIAESVCGFCIGNSQAPGTDAVSIRTSNRNFLGRSGTKSAQVFLTSVETAIASVIKGEITDPRTLDIPFQKIDLPEQFLIDDSMVIKPKSAHQNEVIKRGPNIGAPPNNEPLTDQIKGSITLKVGDKITTDHIMPAGDKLKYRSNIPKYAQFVFFPVDETFSQRSLENKEKNIHNIIIGGLSYGQGSSREHAAICPMFLGVKAVIARSFERIHSANLINFGILPLTFVQEADYQKIDQADLIEINEIKESLSADKELVLLNRTKNTQIKLTYQLTDQDKEMILAGGKLNYLRKTN